MNSHEHFESLYHILVQAEDLLSGSPAGVQRPAHLSYEERVAAMIERGWDLPAEDAQQTVTESIREAPASARHDRPLSEQIGPSDAAPSSGPPAPTSSSREVSREGSREVANSAAPEEQLSAEERRQRLVRIAEQVRSCQACPLSMGRTQAVPGEGALDPMVMIVGEGPGYHEDQQGRPFVGNAGAYLDKWLEAIGITREESAFIANIVKCRPPNNRDPKPEESDVCSPYLRQQIALVRPRLILTVGRISTRILTGSTQGITRIHGTFFRYEGIPLVPTFHPSAVLRNPAYRRPVWEDLKKVRNWLIDHAGHRPQDSAE